MKKNTTQLICSLLLIFIGNLNLYSQIGFSPSQSQGCGPLSVMFTNTTPGTDVYQISWYFQDGSPTVIDTLSYGQTITHLFNNPGNYYVGADFFNITGGFYEGYYSGNTIQVDGMSIYGQDSTCINDPVSFYEYSNIQYNIVSWDFGDGYVTSQQYPQHAYSAAGTYTITLIANSISCGQLIVTKTVYVTNALFPHPVFGANPNPSCPNSPIFFNSNTSYSTYSWDFGDGNTSNLQNPQHAYTAVGNYYSTLMVTNGCGNTGSGSDTVRVSQNVGFPWGMGIGNPSTVCPNEQVNCYVYSNFPFPKYVWDFGDGTPKDSSGSNVTHSFGTNIGTYTISCKVTNNCGVDSVFQNTISVSTYSPFPNQPWFNVNGNSPACPNSNVNLNAPGGYTSYQWDFGDSSPIVTTANSGTNHTYGSPLTSYIASVRITNFCGNDTILYYTVVINNSVHFPTDSWFNLQINSSPACPNSSVSFNAPGGYSQYIWDFGDGVDSVITSYNNSNHTYGDSIRSYSVSVRIINSCGNDTTLYGTVLINNTVSFPNQSWFSLQSNPSPACPNSNVYFDAPNGYNIYQWDFGDGTTVTGNNSGNNHTYGSAIQSYNVSVKITNNCGNDTILYTTVQISSNAPFPNQSWFNLDVNSSPACPNSNIGFYGPGGYSNYLWDFGDGTATATSVYSSYNHTYGSTPGTFIASLKITNGCGNDTTLYTTVVVMNNLGFPNNSGFQLNMSANPVCPNDQMSWNAPYGYSNYLWNFGDGDSVASSSSYANHIYTTTGVFMASVTITNNCGNDTTLYETIAVNNSGVFSSMLQMNASPNISCPNDMVAIYVSDNNFQSYVWNFGDGQTATSTGNNIQHAYSATGNYTISCQVTNGCGNTVTLTTSVLVTGNGPVNSDVFVEGLHNPSCPNDEVFFLVHEGQSNYTYVWNYGDGSPVDTTVGTGGRHVYSNTGTYIITTIVINGCGSTKTITTTVVISNSVMPSLVGDQGRKDWGFPGSENGSTSTAGCAGDAIIFYYMGSSANNVWDFGDGSTGTATESMMIYGGDGSFPITIIKHAYATNGTYLVSLTITNGCGNSVTDTLSITIGGNQTVNGDMTTSPPPFTTCSAIDFLAFGGASYGWDFGDGNTITTFSPTVSHTFATQGIYVVTVLVTNGCGNTATYSRSVNVDGVGGPSVSLTSSTPPTCMDGANGSATLSVSSGLPPYVYSWNDPNGQTSSTATGLPPGLYNATVTDNIGCATTLAVAISNPAPIVLNVLSTTTGCGASTGTASVTVTSGGTGPFTYLWSTGSTNPNIIGLAAGSYSVLTTDASACTSSANVSVSESGGATLSTNTITNVSCYGSATGAININVTGGTGPYSYLWSNGSTIQDPVSLIAGSYSVQVTDISGCIAMLNATVTQPNDMLVATSTSHSPTCGNFDGNAIATPTGGTGPFTYLWDANAASQTTQTALGLPAGTYTVTVTDSKGCSKDGVISLSNSNSPSIIAAQSNVSCFGNGNGAIDIAVSGGTSPYLYTWNVAPPQTNNQDLNNLLPGNYLVFVNDAHGCMSFRSYTITEPALLTATATSTGATCGNNDGTATAAPTGGNSSYTYLWTGGGQTTQTATGLPIGPYTVTITDNKGCTTTGNTVISATTIPTEICLVTVDPLSLHNIIYWEKPAVTNLDSFRIYREDVTSVYHQIASVPFDSLSEYHDYGIDPNTTTKRYKISTLDNCGQESVKSNYHNTIYIVDNGLGQFTWNPLYTIENSGNPVDNYVLMRDDNYTGSWSQVAITAGTQNTLVDPAYGSYGNGQWRVETVWGVSCTSTRATINTTRSNIKGASVSIAKNSNELSNIVVYPNPANDNVSVEFTMLLKNSKLSILNILGQTMYSETVLASATKTVKQINTSLFSKGIYTVVVVGDKVKIIKKLVIN